MPTCNLCKEPRPWAEINFGYHYQGGNVCLRCWPEGAFAPMCWLPARQEEAPEIPRVPDYFEGLDAADSETVVGQARRECPGWVAEEAERWERERHEGLPELKQMEGIR